MECGISIVMSIAAEMRTPKKITFLWCFHDKQEWFNKYKTVSIVGAARSLQDI